jgi:hypothetical protein
MVVLIRRTLTAAAGRRGRPGRAFSGSPSRIGALVISSFGGRGCGDSPSSLSRPVGGNLAGHGRSLSSAASAAPLLLHTWGTNKAGCLLLDDSAEATTPAAAVVWEPRLADHPSLVAAVNRHGPVVHVACGSADTAIVLEDGTVLVAGENKQGQLGLGHKNPVPVPTVVPGIPPMARVALGPNTAAYVGKDTGDLYTCGFGGSVVAGIGALGHGNGESYLTPRLVESLVEDGCSVRDVVLGESQTTVLTTEGEVLTTGSSSYGRLGNGETSEDQLYLDSVEILQEAVQIAGGKSFSLALTKEGVVYGWGRNHRGQLGTGFGMAVDMYSMEQIPTPIDGDELINRFVTKIAAGHSHAACITSTGELFWWGKSLNLEPVRVAEVLHTKIVDVACGQDYTMALSEDHHIYVWGGGKTGVLGVGPNTKNLNQAQMVKSLTEREVTFIAAGWTHAACMTKA